MLLAPHCHVCEIWEASDDQAQSWEYVAAPGCCTRQELMSRLGILLFTYGTHGDPHAAAVTSFSHTNKCWVFWGVMMGICEDVVVGVDRTGATKTMGESNFLDRNASPEEIRRAVRVGNPDSAVAANPNTPPAELAVSSGDADFWDQQISLSEPQRASLAVWGSRRLTQQCFDGCQQRRFGQGRVHQSSPSNGWGRVVAEFYESVGRAVGVGCDADPPPSAVVR